MHYLNILLAVLLTWTPITWALVFMPFIILIAVVFASRAKIAALPTEANVWRTVAYCWRNVGLWVLAGAVSLFVADTIAGYYVRRYQEEFVQALSRRTNVVNKSAQVRQNIARRLVGRIDENNLRDILILFSKDLSEDLRLRLLESILGSHLDPGIVDWGYLLPERTAGSAALPSFALNTDLPLNARQRQLMDNKSWREFWSSLNNNQWMYIIRQIFLQQAIASLMEITVALILELPEKESLQLVRNLLTAVYSSPRQEGIRLAFQAGLPDHAKLFTFLVNNSSWLRPLLWALVWIAVALIILGQSIRMSSARNPFEIVNR